MVALEEVALSEGRTLLTLDTWTRRARRAALPVARLRDRRRHSALRARVTDAGARADDHHVQGTLAAFFPFSAERRPLSGFWTVVSGSIYNRVVRDLRDVPHSWRPPRRPRGPPVGRRRGNGQGVSKTAAKILPETPHAYNPSRMPTPVESAGLILKLYELRRDPLLREARAWFVREFNPATVEELAALASGPKNPWIRMVVGYWDMAASLVVHGAIDREMFLASSSEMLTTFAKLEPFLGPLRDDTRGTGVHGGRSAPDPGRRRAHGGASGIFCASAPVPASRDGRVRVVARFRARPHQTSAVRDILLALVTPTRQACGCISCDLLHNSAIQPTSRS